MMKSKTWLFRQVAYSPIGLGRSLKESENSREPFLAERGRSNSLERFLMLCHRG